MRTLFFLFLFVLFTTSINAQSTWQPIETGTVNDLLCIDFVNNQVGYIGGDQILLKTSNGGMTWQEIQVETLEPVNNEDWIIADIQFFTESHGRIVMGQWQGMAETFDGGVNWTTVTPASSGFCQFGSIYFFDVDQGFAGGAGCFESGLIDRFVSGTWNTTTVPSASNWNGNDDLVRNFDFLDSTTGLACTDGGRILHTTDGGLSWDSISHSLPEAKFTDIAYLTADTVYASYDLLGGFGTYISTDGGLTWDTDWETATFFYPSMYATHVSGNGTVYFAGLNGNDQSTGVVFDTDNGFFNFEALVLPVHDIDSYGDSITFLVGDAGSVYVNVNPISLSVTDLDPSVQLHAYPNPAIDRINISVNARAHEVLGVRLFDMQGREFAIEYTATDYGIPIRLSDVASGQYLIEVTTETGRNVIAFEKE